QFLDQIAQADFVLDQQDGFVAALENGAGAGGRFLRRRVERGEIDFKSASLAGLAINPDASLALLYDAVNGREPEAGSLADALGGEEGLKDMILNLLGHALAGIGDGEADVAARLDVEMGAGIFLVEVDCAGFDRYAAAVRHGVTSIQNKVENDLLDLSRIGAHCV